MEGDKLERELRYHKELACRITENLIPINPDTIRRYTENKNWRFFEKEAVFYHIDKFARDKINIKVCEFGCGEGIYSCQVALVFPSVDVVGIDISPELIAVAQENAALNNVSDRVTFTVADAEEFSLENESIDIMLVLNILHHTELDKTIQKIVDATKKDGLIVIQEPVAFSRTLQFVRDIVPVKKDVSPDERQLSLCEIQYIIDNVAVDWIYYSNIFGRLSRLIPDLMPNYKLKLIKYLNVFDAMILKIFPYMKKYAGRILIIAKKKPS